MWYMKLRKNGKLPLVSGMTYGDWLQYMAVGNRNRLA